MAPMAKKQSESVYRVIDAVGVSETSWEDAGIKAVETAAGSLRDLRVAEVTKRLSRPSARHQSQLGTRQAKGQSRSPEPINRTLTVIDKAARGGAMQCTLAANHPAPGGVKCNRSDAASLPSGVVSQEAGAVGVLRHCSRPHLSKAIHQRAVGSLLPGSDPQERRVLGARHILRGRSVDCPSRYALCRGRAVP
jgi:flavin-binding protein dodecin